MLIKPVKKGVLTLAYLKTENFNERISGSVHFNTALLELKYWYSDLGFYLCANEVH